MSDLYIEPMVITSPVSVNTDNSKRDLERLDIAK